MKKIKNSQPQTKFTGSYKKRCKTCVLPVDFALERDPKNIFHFQRDVENYTDQVLNFLLFDRHEYIRTESSGL